MVENHYPVDLAFQPSYNRSRLVFNYIENVHLQVKSVTRI
jgi:hypothetical protein